MYDREDDFMGSENPFFDGLSVFPASPQPATSQFAVAPTASALNDDDYTGRMGPDGEPERYSTMRGGDPRVRQQRELELRQQRLQEPFALDNWLKSAGKDARGTTAASQITLNPGTKYQIRDYSGKNDGQIIASGSTPEEFLMMQDVARGLARQGTNADYRIEQVGGTAQGGFGQYRDPATGEVITTLGGDLYNKPIAGDIIKIALPLALNVIPGLGLGAALGGKLGLSGLAAKAAGVGLTSALGRTGAGVLTGENVGDALKSGAITGLASGATAGLLGATGADKAIGSALGGAKGSALGGELASRATEQVASSLPGEIVVSAARNALAPTILGGLGAAGGSLLGDVGKSLVQPDPFQQAMDQARLDNEFGLGETVVSGSRIADVNPAAGAPDAIRNIVSATESLGRAPDTVEEEALVTGRRYGDPNLGGEVVGGGAGALSAVEGTVDQELLAEADRIKRFEAEAAAAAAAAAAATAGTSALTAATVQPGDDPIIDVEADSIQDTNLDSDLAAASTGHCRRRVAVEG